jgi:NADPH-dependent 2,4-dienoyl-CoA reductase/sulfur reductase-like enzyme/nitrite reductase/ring-hydroxylating ferredoxin subunit
VSDRDLSNGIPIADLPDGSMIAGKLGEEEILLAREGDEVHAVGAHCSHYHAPLVDGMLAGGTVRCPWHHACFDLKTGAVLRAPALTPLPVWRVERRGDRFFVREKTGGTVVIIGSGAAGVNVAETLRREGHTGRITMISGETELPYDKPNLSKDYMAGNAPVEWLPLYTQEHYDEQKIDLKLGITVTAIDIAAKQVTTSDGQGLAYDTLVLATGSSPRRLDVPGAERAHYLRTRSDGETIVARAATAKRAVVVGSSFIGLEVAASLRQKGLAVVVVSPQSTPLEHILGPRVGSYIRSIHEKHGVEFRLGRGVASIKDDAVVLDDGSEVHADLVVAGIGVVPDVELARAAGLETGNGIIVDEFLETSAAGVFACGDVASWPDAGGAPHRIEHWVVAGRQGQSVARNILGKRQPFTAVPFFWSAHYDVVIGYVGHAPKWESVEIDGSLEANDATIAYRQGGQIRAVATIGRDRTGLAAEEAMERGDWQGLEAIVKGGG